MRALAIVALTLAACALHDEEGDRPRAPGGVRHEASGALRLSDAARATLDLAVTPAVTGILPDTTLRFGRVQARIGDESLVVAPVAGRVLAAPVVAVGEAVTAGQVLVTLTPVLSVAERATFRVQGAELGGQVEVAARDLANREAALARSRTLAADDIVSRARLQEAETAVAVARAQVAAATRARGLATGATGDGAGTAALRAPTAGTLVALGVTMGALVPAGGVVARIVRPGARWIDLAVPPDDDAGTAYELALGARRIATGLVARGSVVEDDGARHDRLATDPGDAIDLPPGLVVPVRVAHSPSSTGVVVPEDAIVPGAGGDAVYVEVAPNVFAARPVGIVARFGGRVRVGSGLRAGERVVTRGAMALRSEALRDALANPD